MSLQSLIAKADQTARYAKAYPNNDNAQRLAERVRSELVDYLSIRADAIDELIRAATLMLDNDGRDGVYDATALYEARAYIRQSLERLK